MEIGITLGSFDISVCLLSSQEILLGLWAGEYMVAFQKGYRPAKALHIGAVFLTFIVRKYEKTH